MQRAWKNACKNTHRLVSPSQPTGAEGLRPLDAAKSALEVARIDGSEIARANSPSARMGEVARTTEAHIGRRLDRKSVV